MSERAEADELLRLTVAGWLEVNGRGHPDEVLGDLVLVAHFRSWLADETQVDDYEVVVPAGVSYHSALGLLHHAVDSRLVTSGDDEDDDEALDD